MKIRSDNFNCAYCEKDVVFRVVEIEDSAGERSAPVSVPDGNILSDSGCGVRLAAEQTGQVTQADLLKCPYYSRA